VNAPKQLFGDSVQGPHSLVVKSQKPVLVHRLGSSYEQVKGPHYI
jgi:hypothetical protein